MLNVRVYCLFQGNARCECRREATAGQQLSREEAQEEDRLRFRGNRSGWFSYFTAKSKFVPFLHFNSFCIMLGEFQLALECLQTSLGVDLKSSEVEVYAVTEAHREPR